MSLADTTYIAYGTLVGLAVCLGLVVFLCILVNGYREAPQDLQ